MPFIINFMKYYSRIVKAACFLHKRAPYLEGGWVGQRKNGKKARFIFEFFNIGKCKKCPFFDFIKGNFIKGNFLKQFYKKTIFKGPDLRSGQVGKVRKIEISARLCKKHAIDKVDYCQINIYDICICQNNAYITNNLTIFISCFFQITKF